MERPEQNYGHILEYWNEMHLENVLVKSYWHYVINPKESLKASSTATSVTESWRQT